MEEEIWVSESMPLFGHGRPQVALISQLLSWKDGSDDHELIKERTNTAMGIHVVMCTGQELMPELNAMEHRLSFVYEEVLDLVSVGFTEIHIIFSS